MIRYTFTLCSLGHLLIAETEKGICAILIGDDEPALLDDLQRRFPDQSLQFIEETASPLTKSICDFIDEPQAQFPLPLDPHGTVFQHKVWQALRQIPPGETLSYAELAQAIGAPKAARAVAGACAANPLAVVVPCHRIVRNDGALSGYRWGVERKRRLLAKERLHKENTE